MVVGSRAQVMHGAAERTAGGLTKKDLKYTSDGRIISKAASKASKGNPWVTAVAKARKQLAKGSAADKKASKEMLVKGKLAAAARKLMK